MAMSAGFPEGEELPERVGPYTIRRRIGQGGMGVVYQAVDPRQDRLVAIKVLRPEVAGDDIARARLNREVATMRRVHSANVAEVIDADTDAELPWVVTEYIPGPTLDSTVTDHGPLRGRALSRYVRGLARAIEDIHAADVIHRDLKPGNVIISNGEPIVIDFGIAHAVDGAKLTQTGTFVGTPSYLSPEVIEGTDLGPATDIHAWGGTVAFASTGNPPYGAGSFEVIFFRILNGEITLDGMPDQLKPLVHAAVSRDMSARPTAADLVAQTARLNLDLPLDEDVATYVSSGLTGNHTVQAATSAPAADGGENSGSGDLGATAAGAGAIGAHETYGGADRTRVGGADQTYAAGSGGADQTRVAGADQTMRAEPDEAHSPQQTGMLGTYEAEESPSAGPSTQYFNSTLRPEDFRDVLTPVDERSGAQGSGQAEESGGLFGRFRGSGGDRLDDYFDHGSEDDHSGGYYGAEPEGRPLPRLMLIPILVFLAGICLAVPPLGLIVGLLTASILGGLDMVKAEHARRLQTRGPRSSDTMVVALSMPWALLRSLGTNLMYGVGYLLAGIVVGIVITLLTRDGTNTPNFVGSYAFTLVVVLSFLGPNGRGAVRQARAAVDSATVRNPYLYWGVIVASVLLAMLVVSYGVGSAPSWWLMGSGPSDWPLLGG